MCSPGSRAVRTTLSASYLLMGFTLAVSQALLIRELLVAFGGHELALGVMLGGWLALEALGSVTLGRRLAGGSRAVQRYALLQAAFALALGAILVLIYGIHNLGGWTPGRALGLPAVFGLSAALLMPVSLVDGAMFAVACGMDAARGPDGGDAVRRVYVLEAVGGIVGGLAFTYLCIPYLAPAQMALLVAGLNLGGAGALLLWVPVQPEPRERGFGRIWRVSALLGAAILLAGALSPVGARLQQRLIAWRWRGQDVRFYGDSPYGNVVAVRQREQITVFSNGLPAMTVPWPDVALVEEIVHLGMLHVPEARHVLVLGGGLEGILSELLLYPLTSVTCAEMDPLLVEALMVEPTPLVERLLGDPRARIEHVDGRMLARRQAAAREALADEALPRYDLILVHLAYATTLQLNRFYTIEMVSLLQKLLAERGLIVYTSPGSTAYLSPEMRDLNARLRETLGAAFALRPIPDDVTLWLAAHRQEVVEVETETLVERWRALGVKASLIGPHHIALKHRPGLRDWFEAELSRVDAPVVNRDLQPYGLLDGLAYWSAAFSPEVLSYLNLLKRIKVWHILAAGGVAVAMGWIAAARKRGVSPVVLAIGATGFAGMSIDLSVVLAVQVLHGYVYHLIGMLIAAFMAGLSLGGWLSSQGAQQGDATMCMARLRSRFLALEGLLLIYVAALPLLLGVARSWASVPDWLGPAYLLGLNAAGGLLVGAQFPLANRLLRDHQQRATDAAASLYSADLLGAFAAALLISTALIPSVGIHGTCTLLILLKAGSLTLVLARA